MPRSPRSVDAGTIYHVLNRGNGRMRLFHKDEDFASFERILGTGLERYPVDLLTYCLMGNHWHLVVRPRRDSALSDLMRWISVTHVRRHHQHYHNADGGHLYQGRFKSFPVQEDGHFLRVCRYVEANAFRAKLVAQAEDWAWSGLAMRSQKIEKPFALTDWPVDRPARWTTMVNEPSAADELLGIRLSVDRGRPFGDPAWTKRVAAQQGLASTLRDRGRPVQIKKRT